MDEKLEQQLFEKYPTIFPGGRNVDPKQSLICFGLEVGDGWFKLIDKLCEDILKCDGGDKVVCVQLKEKFGGIRFYINGAPEEVHDLIMKAERDSFKICETCGEKGKLDEIKGWMVTICEKCKDKRLKETNSRGGDT